MKTRPGCGQWSGQSIYWCTVSKPNLTAVITDLYLKLICSRDGQLIILLLACPSLPKMSLLITIFLLVFVTQLIAWIGKSVLLDIVCRRYNFLWQFDYIKETKKKKTYDLYLRITLSPMAMRQRALKSEILSTKSELLKTSAQDQFAKWAKLRRSVDKGLADLEKLSEFVYCPLLQHLDQFICHLFL